MPVYDYQCTDCTKTYDIYHKSSISTENIVCPNCGSKNHKRLMSTASINMNGPVKSSGNDFGAGSCNMGGCSSGMCGLN